MADLLIKNLELPEKGSLTLTVDSFGFVYRDGRRLDTEIDGQPKPCCDNPIMIMEEDHGDEPTLYRIFCDHCGKSTKMHESYSDALREWNFGFVSEE